MMMRKVPGLFFMLLYAMKSSLASVALNLSDSVVESYSSLPSDCLKPEQPCGNLTLLSYAYEYYSNNEANKEIANINFTREDLYCLPHTIKPLWISNNSTYMKLLTGVDQVGCQNLECDVVTGVRELAVLTYNENLKVTENCYRGWCKININLTLPVRCQCQKADCQPHVMPDATDYLGAGIIAPGESSSEGSLSPWSKWYSCDRCNSRQWRNRRCLDTNNKCVGSLWHSRPCAAPHCQSTGRTPTWGSWGEWRPCSTTCGPGIQYAFRNCLASVCATGDAWKYRTCQLRTCQENPSWTAWSQWTQCTKTCGKGSQTRWRRCTVFGQCTGSSFETVECAIRHDCPGCQCSDWSDWSACSPSCDAGVQSKRRVCSGTNCPSQRQYQYCFNSCVEPTWNSWDEWGDCSKTCGSRSQIRHRGCSIPGRCEGGVSETRNCQHITCPIPATWDSWGPWRQCSRTCGWGSKRRTRRCSQSNGCRGSDSETQDCRLLDRCPEWNSWSQWGQCSKTCGAGSKSRTRRCSLNDRCPGKSTDTIDCTSQDCTPDTDALSEWYQWRECECGKVQWRWRRCLKEPCNINDQWQSQTCALKKCSECTEGSAPSNGAMSGGNALRDVRRFSCNDGYSLEGAESVTCENQGGTPQWSASFPTCKRQQSCENPPDISNGVIQGDSHREGDQITYICNFGYFLSGYRTRTCQNKSWTPESTPNCKKILCERPEVPSHGQMQGTQFSFQSSVTFRCDPGYKLVGERTLTCQANGDWNHREPICDLSQLRSCPAPVDPEGGQVQGSAYHVGSTITYTCEEGYDLEGSSISTCIYEGNDAVWSGEPPRCEARAQPCGKLGRTSRVKGGRVVGGVVADKNAWPWVAEIRVVIGDHWYHHCGGSLIDEQWVITAAHCTYPGGGRDLEVVLGEHDLEKVEGQERSHRVTEIIRHPDYRYGQHKHDVALLKISPTALLDNAIQLVCLPNRDYSTLASSQGIIMGWGSTDPSGKGFSLWLMQLSLPFISFSSCNGPSMYDGRMVRGMFCAGFQSGLRDSCKGDSGGPLVYHDRGSYFLTGIVSWGEGCAKRNRPGVYTNVYHYRSWIENNIMP